MKMNPQVKRILFYQNLGFLGLVILCVVDELLQLPSLNLAEHPLAFIFRWPTLELLLTSPVDDWQVVVGKYLGSLILFAVMLLAPTLLYVVFLIAFGFLYANVTDLLWFHAAAVPADALEKVRPLYFALMKLIVVASGRSLAQHPAAKSQIKTRRFS